MIDLLQKTAAPDSSKYIRQYAQKTLRDQVAANPKSSLIQSAHIFTNQTIVINTRLNASALVLYCLRQKSQNALIWDSLQHPQKVMFNDLILTSMIDQDRNIRRSAANIIATICCMEIPRGGWEDTIKNITSNTKSEDFIVKQVSFLTLGFICEGLSSDNLQLNINVQQQILAAILHGILDNPSSVVETAFKALRDGMKSFSDLFIDPINRQFLLKLICEALALQYANLSLQCLIQYTKFNLNYITQDILLTLAQKIQPFLQNYKNTQTCILAMEFWSSLIKTQQFAGNFQKLKASESTNKALQTLIQIIYTSSEQQEMINAAENAIYSIISQNFQAYQFYLQNFIDQACISSDIKIKKAGIIVQSVFFICSPLGKKKEYGQTLLSNLYKLILDNNYGVRRLVTHQLSKIAEESAENLISHPNFINFLQLSIEVCYKDQQMMRDYANMLYFLADDPEKRKVRTNIRKLYQFFINLLGTQQQSIDFIKDCLCSLSNLLSINTDIKVALQSINYVQSNFSLIQNLSNQRQQIYYQGLLTMAHSSLYLLRDQNVQLPQQIGFSLYRIVVEHFQKIQNVDSDGFFLVTAILNCMPQQLIIHEDFWKYIKFGLFKYQQSDIFKGVLNCICKIFQFHKGEGINQKISFTLHTLLKLFQSTNVSRQLKLQILITIGDLCLRCGTYCQPFLTNIIDFIRISMQGVLELNDFNYAEILQDTVVETLLCILHSDFSAAAFQTIKTFVESILQFIAFSTDKKRRPKLSYLKDTMSLLVDVIVQFPQIKQVISREFVDEKISLLVKFGLEKQQIYQISFLRNQFCL